MSPRAHHLLVLAGVFLTAACSGQVGRGASIKGGLQSTPHHPPRHSDPNGDSQTRDRLNQMNQFYSTATATVLQEFATEPDIDGNMLIDNTVIVYLTEVARAWDHNQQNAPLINDMWLALMPIFGVNMARLGVANQSTGTLAGITNLT
jgi:hypothetical protein